MKAMFVCLALIALLAPPAAAIPGDPRIVQGTMVWPAMLDTEPFVVIRGDDGQFYAADVVSAQRQTTTPLAAGSRVSVAGVEGARPWDIAATAIGAGATAAVPAPVPEPSASVATAPAGAQPLWRLHGTVQSLADNGTRVVLRTADGKDHHVDISNLSDTTRRALRRGDEITLFGIAREPEGRLVANGFVQGGGAPAASPSTGR